MRETLRSLPPTLNAALVIVAIVVLAHVLDPWAQVALSDPDLINQDLGRMLRIMGFYPLWALAGVALLLTDRPLRPPLSPTFEPPIGPAARSREWGARGGALIVSPLLGGLVAEVGKILFRRLRPGEIPGEYFFRSWTERPFYSGGLGLPSSHVLVAFAGAAMLARIFPRAAPVWFALAVGCAWTRVAAGAHYLSDVAVAGVLGWLVAWAVGRWIFPKAVAPRTA